MKKTFAQPELEVVRVKKNDIITESAMVGQEAQSGWIMEAPGRRESWDEGY